VALVPRETAVMHETNNCPAAMAEMYGGAIVGAMVSGEIQFC